MSGAASPSPVADAIARALGDSEFAAQFPHRFFALPSDPNTEADVIFVWQPLPWPDDTLASILRTIAAGGGVVLMAASLGQLVRMRESLELMLAPGARA